MEGLFGSHTRYPAPIEALDTMDPDRCRIISCLMRTRSRVHKGMDANDMRAYHDVMDTSVVGGGISQSRKAQRRTSLSAAVLRSYIHASPNKSKKKKTKKKPCPYSRTGDIAEIGDETRLVYTRGTGSTLYIRWNGGYTKLSQVILALSDVSTKSSRSKQS